MTTTMTEFVWQPTGEYLKCRVNDFVKENGLKDWEELVKRSNEDVEWFWERALKFLGVSWTKPYDKLLDKSEGFEWAKWFVGGELNIAQNCLDWHQKVGDKLGQRTSVGRDHMAIIWEGEDGSKRNLTYGELNELAGRVAGTLKKLGIGAGEAVGIYMPMVPEVVAVLFGCLKVGAVAVPVFSGYGSDALRARLEDSEARILFTADAGRRKGKLVDIKGDADEAAFGLPLMEHVVVLRHCGAQVKWTEGRDLWWDEVVAKADIEPTKLDLPAEHPSMYLYTSGTTGKPKGTVHTHGGALATISKEHGFTFDVRPEDVFFWVTDIGWMMGPWEMIGVTFWGGTMVIYEGAPNFPTPDRVWQIVEREKVTKLGISPTLIRVLKPAGDEWVHKHDMGSLKMLGSTGEPWDADSYMWFHEKVGGSRCPIMNISGGTEIVGCLLMPLPTMPLKACTLGTKGLAMDIDVFDESGNSVRNQIGYLVCKQPAPSMTKGFLKAPDRYVETYFSKFPGVWYHGDWAKVDDDGSWFLYGRSDDTIKVAGKRVGPGEIESILVDHAEVAEAAVVGVPNELKGEALACFVVMMPGSTLTDKVVAELREMVGHRLGPVMRPDTIYAVKTLPKTRSGKIVRRAIRAVYLGETSGDISSVENIDALEEVKAFSSRFKR